MGLEELGVSTKQLLHALDVMGDMVAIIDPQRRIRFANQALRAAFPRQKVVGAYCFKLFHGRDEQSPACLSCAVFDTGRPAYTEIEEKHLGRHLQIAAFPLPGSKGDVELVLHTFADVTERREAERALAENEKRLRFLATQLSLAEERERRKIATELHDSVSQSLAMCRLHAGQLRKKTDGEIRQDVDHLMGMLDQLISEARSLTRELFSPALYDLGLASAIASLGDRFLERFGIRFNFRQDDQPRPLKLDVRIELFKSVRELLKNVSKHSRAGEVSVSLERVGDTVAVTVEDDGIGFEVAEVVSRIELTSGFGLFSIRERMTALGGAMEIDARPGDGTRVELVLPVDDPDEAVEKNE